VYIFFKSLYMEKYLYIDNESILIFNVAHKSEMRCNVNSWGDTICISMNNRFSNDKPLVVHERHNDPATSMVGIYVVVQKNTNTNMFMKVEGNICKFLVPENPSLVASYFRNSADNYPEDTKILFKDVANYIEIPDIWYGYRPLSYSGAPKVLKQIDDCPEILWPFLQNIEPCQVSTFLNVYKIKGGRQCYPLDIQLVDKYLLYGERSLRVYKGANILYSNDSLGESMIIVDNGFDYDLR
jgi:hypothetical protein